VRIRLTTRIPTNRTRICHLLRLLPLYLHNVLAQHIEYFLETAVLLPIGTSFIGYACLGLGFEICCWFPFKLGHYLAHFKDYIKDY
jgi:hypothetical protein